MTACTNIEYNYQNFVCVHHLANVKNVDKALKTIKGEAGLTKVYNSPNQRLSMRFRLDDPYSKSANADRFNTTNLLMKLVTRTKTLPNGEEEVEFEIKFLGPINVSYKFNGLMDYQLLPLTLVQSDPKPQYQDILPQLIPQGLVSKSWLKEPCPLFIQPPLFSRSDQPQKFNFTSNQSLNENVAKLVNQGTENIALTARMRILVSAHIVHFDQQEVPDKPREEALKFLKKHFYDSEILEQIKEKFQEQPIWSRHELAAVLKVPFKKLKIPMPVVAYYFVSGPWRGTWVRFGYNPRLHPEAKIHQTLDFRIRAALSVAPSTIPFKRCSYTTHLPNRVTSGLSKNPARIEATALSRAEQIPDTFVSELTYKFKPDSLPCYRQTLYQLRNIEVPEVQMLIHENDGMEDPVCHEKDGWCLPGVLDRCRDIISDITQNNLLKLAKEKGEKSEQPHFLDDDDDANLDVIESFGFADPNTMEEDEDNSK